jgi:hypothetical protein
MISWYSIFAKRKERNMSHGGIYMHLSVVLIYFSVLNCNTKGEQAGEETTTHNRKQ